MKKTLILTSLLAIVATTGAASADTDVTFGGNYSLATDPEGTMSGTVTTEPNATDTEYDYSYTTFDGTITGSQTNNSNVAPEYSQFKYIDTNGDAVALAEDTEFALAEDYAANVTATRTYVFNEGDPEEYTLEVYTAEAGQNLHAYVGEHPVEDNYGVDINNYTYKGADGEVYNLSEQPTFTQTRDLLADVVQGEDYTIALADGYMTSVSATNGTPTSDALDGSNYILHASNGLDFRLTEDGTGFRRLSDGATVDVADYSDYAAEFNALKDAYDADYDAIYAAGGIVATTQASYNTVSADYEKALEFYNGDITTAGNLTTNYESQALAQGYYNDAVRKHGAAQDDFTNSHIAYENASALYNTSVSDAIATGANDAIDASVAGGTIKTALDGKQENLTDSQLAAANSGITADKVSAYDAYATAISDETARATGVESSLDGRITDNATAIADEITRATTQEAAIRSEFAAADAETLASAKAYSDAGDELTLNAAKAYADAGNTVALNQAKAYTDERVEKLDKDLSAGVASAIALSSVSVSGVKRGEVSVGGGYGYFNGQSAAAFGAAMGLSDRWSVNAGAGVSNADIAVRAGTNYKFKLF